MAQSEAHVRNQRLQRGKTEKCHSRNVQLIAEIQQQQQVSGAQTCKLAMSSLAAELKSSSDISYSQYDLESNKHLPAVDFLKQELGLEYAGE